MTAGSGPGSGGSKHPVKVVANIFISFIGAGVLGLPFAFKEAGIIEGTLVMTFVGLVSVKAMLLIVDCKYKILDRRKGKHGYSNSAVTDEDGLALSSKDQKKDLLKGEGDLVIRVKDPPRIQVADLSYGDVGFEAMGHMGKFLVDLAIVISQTGFCCAYLIFISQNLSDYFPGMKLGHWLLILLPPLSLLTLLRQLSSLSISSLMAQCSNLMAFGVVFWFDFEHFYNIEIHPKNMSIRGLPFFLAIAIYCYEGAGMILSLEASLEETIRHNFKKFFISTMVAVTLLYITFGVCGYLSFGPDTNPIITLNLPKGQSVDFSMIVKSFLCLALYFTYPVMMFPVMKVMERYFVPDADKNIWRGNILRVCMVLCTGTIVTLIPNFANLMALIGSGCCTLLAFILPGLFHMKIFSGSRTRSQTILDWSLVAIGVLGTVVGLIDAFKRLNEGEPPKSVATTLSSLNNVTTTVSSTIIHTVLADVNISHSVAGPH